MSTNLERLIQKGFSTKNIERNFHLQGLSPEEQKIYKSRLQMSKNSKNTKKLIIPSKINR